MIEERKDNSMTLHSTSIAFANVDLRETTRTAMTQYFQQNADLSNQDCID